MKIKFTYPEGWTFICLLFHDRRCLLFLCHFDTQFLTPQTQTEVGNQRPGAQGKLPGTAFISKAHTERPRDVAQYILAHNSRMARDVGRWLFLKGHDISLG